MQIKKSPVKRALLWVCMLIAVQLQGICQFEDWNALSAWKQTAGDELPRSLLKDLILDLDYIDPINRRYRGEVVRVMRDDNAVRGFTLAELQNGRALSGNLVTNGDFSDGDTGWTANNAVISVANGQMTVDDSANAGSWSTCVQNVGLSLGNVYKLSVNVASTTQSLNFFVSSTPNTDSPSGFSSTSVGRASFDYIFTSSGSGGPYIGVGVNLDGVAVFNDISVHKWQPSDFEAWLLEGGGTGYQVLWCDTSVIDPGMYFDGASNYVKTGVIPPQAGMIELTAVFDTFNDSDQMLIGSRDVTDTRCYIDVNQFNRIRFAIGNDFVSDGSGDVLGVGVPYTFTLEWGAGSYTGSVNGVEVVSRNYTGTVSTIEGLYIGCWNNNGVATNFAPEGSIRNVKIYDDAGQVIHHWRLDGNQAENARDVVGSSDGTIEGDAKKYDWASQRVANSIGQTTAGALPIIAENGTLLNGGVRFESAQSLDEGNTGLDIGLNDAVFVWKASVADGTPSSASNVFETHDIGNSRLITKILATGRFRLDFVSSSGVVSSKDINLSQTIPDATECIFHLSLVRDALATFTWTEIANPSNTGTGSIGISSTATINIGDGNDNPWTLMKHTDFVASIQYFKVWTRALTEREQEALFN